jgi:hypothetical protein
MRTPVSNNTRRAKGDTWKQRAALLLFALAMVGAGLTIDAVRPARAEIVLTEPASFELNSVIDFTEPTLGCPNVDDAVAADGKTAEWLATRGCKNLDTNMHWVVASAGDEHRRGSGRRIMTYGCVVPEGRWSQTKVEAQRRDTYGLGTTLSAWSQQMMKECWNVVRRIDQVRARATLPVCTDPTVMNSLRSVVRANEVYTLKEVESDGSDGQRWCYAAFSAPYPGPNGSTQEVSFTLEWMGGLERRFWLQANNLQQSWRFDGEPPKAVLRDIRTIDRILRRLKSSAPVDPVAGQPTPDF